MHFIQETGFTFELDQIETDPHSAEALMRGIEELCRCSVCDIVTGYGRLSVTWNGTVFVVWYCVTGGDVTLRSITPETV